MCEHHDCRLNGFVWKRKIPVAGVSSGYLQIDQSLIELVFYDQLPQNIKKRLAVKRLTDAQLGK